jgi:tetratricopeptide (TPR) repeat protein
MAKKTDKTDKTEERIVAVEEAFSKTEQYIEKNQKIILIIVGSLVVIFLAYFVGFRGYYLPGKEKEAQTQMFMAEKYFEMDSLNKALNGDGNYPGFLEIIDQYGLTKCANLAHYYTGIIYLKKGEFQKAIEYLEDFKGKEEVVGPMATCAIGDAYMELKNTDKAVEYYLKASKQKPNEFLSPAFLMKAAMAYEEQGKYDKSLEIYKQIKNDFPRSNEARDLDKYISRATGLIKK